MLIVGEGDERTRLEAAIAKYELHGVVVLAGFQSDVSSYLHAFSIFTMPSLQEGLCTSLLDALQVPLPIVASRTGGIPEIVEHEVTGLLAAPGDADDLADGIARMAEDPQSARGYAEEGRAKVEREFSIDRTVEGTIENYRELIAEK